MKRTFLLFIVAALLPLALVAQKVNLKALDKYYGQMVKDWNIPSMSIGIVKDGELIFSKGYGVLEVGETGQPDQNTLYAIASNSKAFTSALVAILVQEGKLSWDDKVQDHLPYFEIYDPYISGMVTIRDLLCHRTGLGTFSGDIGWYKANRTSEDIIKGLKHLPKAFEFRAGFGYSNVMYITAGEIIEKVTGKSWYDNVKERILEPLGMDRTITSVNKLESTGNFATPHALINDENVPVEWTSWEEIGAMGGLISSVKDVSKWMIFNMNHGIVGEDTILSKKSRNTLWTPHNNFTVDHTEKNDFNRHFNAYGLGWALSDYHGNLMVGHTGGYDGMISAITMIPDKKLGVVVLTNGQQSPIRAATNYALDAFFGNKGKDWSKELLEKMQERKKKDTRVEDMKAKRVEGTKPSLDLEKYTGTYHSAIYGNLQVSLNPQQQLRLTFEHSPGLSATLSHWHYDVWEIRWDDTQPWFGFGTVQFKMDNDLNVIGMHFNVPNYDFHFEELEPEKARTGEEE